MSDTPDTREADRSPSLTADVVDIDRPWGHTRQLALNRPCTVKCITVQPGRRVSLQRHAERAELWQVLDGPLLVQVGENERLMQAGELVEIAVGVPHRVGNPGPGLGRFLEVCFGRFDELDIERLEDDYGR
ncbi:mannose-6-phosphate isomerase-like protein (cupin superfamily) [Nakamurella flavida]|uniref:phosphomannose isomerase type II C-terminal cupin domain n=1 Tax=Nakamurella flavida TaxID=363630 RepID=UPI00277F647B|nr:phosphomannose isomerase type II C-terminal cupin domain [Nakamurella flavida]MDP9778438.1 mannose-6-phosphate isomerase-like protein (cupin superfamily) [Nakamurella flavida]